MTYNQAAAVKGQSTVPWAYLDHLELKFRVTKVLSNNILILVSLA
jgi:hypothetical protein